MIAICAGMIGGCGVGSMFGPEVAVLGAIVGAVLGAMIQEK